MVGMKCSFTGVVIDAPDFKRVKSGTVPLMSMTVCYTEARDKTQICRVNFFGGHAVELSEKLRCGDHVEVAGKVCLNTWQSNGQLRTGLLVTAALISKK